MRYSLMLAALLVTTSCSTFGSATSGHANAIDPAMLAPLSGREQSLLISADAAVQQGNQAVAERDYLSAIGASSGHVDAYLGLARLYASTGQSAKQRETLNLAREWQPDHPLVNYMLGKLDLADNANAQALEDFQRGLKTKPSDADLLNGAGIASDMMGDQAGAQIYYGRAISTNAASANLMLVRTNLAMSYLLSNQPKRAVILLKDEVKKPAASTVMRHNLALAYGLMGETAQAKKLLKGEVDEPTRILSVARLKEYIRDHAEGKNPTPPKTIMSGE